MSVLKGMLMAEETNERSWQEALSEMQLAINCTMNRVTKHSAMKLMIGNEAMPMGMLPVNEEVRVDLNRAREEAL